MAIIDLATFKTFIGVTGDTQDTLLQIYVDAANDFVKIYTNRIFEETEYTETYDGSGSVVLILKQYPIVEIDSIFEDGDEVTEREDVNDDGYFTKDLNTGIIYNTSFWNKGRGNIEITYTAGYDTIPGDLTYAVLSLASFFRNMQQRQGIRSESMGSWSVSLMNEANGELAIPDIAVRTILERYRSRARY